MMQPLEYVGEIEINNIFKKVESATQTLPESPSTPKVRKTYKKFNKKIVKKVTAGTNFMDKLKKASKKKKWICFNIFMLYKKYEFYWVPGIRILPAFAG